PENCQPLTSNRMFLAGETGDVAARARKARDKTAGGRVGDRNKYNRDSAGLPLQCTRRFAAHSYNDIRDRAHQVRHVRANVARITIAPAVLDADIATVYPPRFREFFRK